MGLNYWNQSKYPDTPLGIAVRLEGDIKQEATPKYFQDGLKPSGCLKTDA